MKTTAVVLALGLVFTLGCRAISKQAKTELAQPVNCDTAQEDIRILKAEHASVAKQFAEGVTAITPAGAVLSILTLQEEDKLKVAVGDYNHRLKRKIHEIQTVCNIS